ncbi:MAG: patatin-like phospholipase family protein [Bacteroidales bacterium]|nr:patatin-like phospholipase family protein [Bacteroidales bacterium]MCF8345343.1 patatin-like phospholipase family protein [Bacteroidales bacterium]MCF8352609.1 patatin-like phospholipase family protein [Bacteroidales bacterium]MCF8375232.1 patatin-like phospholipase family protein [Bacteroidales bacterium]MCF8400256.1 patatin-like phospholipase family protein [Bacteroidales bacterium]
MILRLALFFIVSVGSLVPVAGQRVALVLSGGGSKGVAHIGVIKALEENKIPVDYIAGTSMGAIIGAMYASGYSPAEMKDLMTSGEIQNWASGNIDDKYIYYFKRRNPDASMISIPFNIKKKFVPNLPANIVSPIQMDFELIEYLSGSVAVADYNFDSLFVPFRCVAADIDSNKFVELKRGQLSSAVRASMTYPFYFRPIEIDGVLLFDGGMYNNFPVDVAIRDFDPDVIIGSKAAGNYDSPTKDDIISQLQNMLMENTDYSLREHKGVLINPDLPSTNVIDFSRAEIFIDSGYIATLQKIDEIKSIVNRRIDPEELQQRRAAFKEKEPAPIIDSIYIYGLNNRQSDYFRRELMNKRKLVTLEELKQEYFKLIADEHVDFIYPQLYYNKKTGFYDLYLDVSLSEQFTARFGGNISSVAVNEAFVGLQYNFLGKNATTLLTNAYFGRFYSSFKLNGRFDFASIIPFFLELDMTYNHYDYFKNTTYFFEDKEPSFLVQNENYTSMAFGFPATNKGKLMMGASVGRIKSEYYQMNNFSRTDTADNTYFNLITPYITYELNSLNRKQFATAGARFLLSTRYVSGKERNIPGSTGLQSGEYESFHDYFSLRMIWENYFYSRGHYTLGVYSHVYISNQKLFNNYTSSILSAQAFQPFPESKTLFLPNYRAHNFAGLGLVNIIHVFNNFNFRIGGYVMQPYRQIMQDLETRKAYYGNSFATRAYIGSAAVVYHTPIGPISLSFNYYDRTHDKLSFILNFGYILFNGSVLE